MGSYRRWGWLAVVTAACVTAGCSDSETTNQAPSEKDAGWDTGPDSATDSGTDTGSDTGKDVEVDTDSGGDSAPDTCAIGYTGPNCTDCADGYQDNDEDGSCLPDCGTTKLACQVNQVCDDSGGKVACVCIAGFQDNDNDGSCLANCATAALTCGPNEECSDASGTALCACADGYQDFDGDGSCLADCTTAALDCSGNGQCDDSSGKARCLCDEGYDGRKCAVCDSPYWQDFDGDGVCETTCYYAATTCGADEVCSDKSGSKECICAAGYQDNDKNGTCEPDCATAMAAKSNPLVCPSANARCDDTSGTASCVCETGYADDPAQTGNDCLACATGYQDNDGDGVCTKDCATALSSGLVCGALGCDDASGVAACNCPAGQQDKDFDGVCKANCATANLNCDATKHEVCDDGSGTSLCVCEAGYYHDGQGACLLVGGEGNACADMLPLSDLTDGILISDMTGMTGEFAFSCNAYGFPYIDMVHHIHVGAGTTRDLSFSVNLFDPQGRPFIPVVSVREGVDCLAATEVACGFGVSASGYLVPATAELTLEGGTAGKDYYLVVGLFDYFGTGATRAVTTVTNLCPDGMMYSPTTDGCVDNPCIDPNPCVEANKNACKVDAFVVPATYTCSCNPGFVADGAGVCQVNATAEGEGCGDVIGIPAVAGPGPQIAGSTENALDDGESKCSASPAPDRVYGFTLVQRMRANFTLNPDVGFDGLLHLRTACDDPDSEVHCEDIWPDGVSETFSRVLQPGSYFLFVDGWDSRPDPAYARGSYTLDYSFYTDPCANEEAACPGAPVCRAKNDWSGYECVCENPGEAFHNGNCVEDPCATATCGPNSHCAPNLANQTFDCPCDAVYVEDGAGGCKVKPDAQWTFMMYWSMDNNLFNQSLPELQDWVNVDYNEDVRLIVLVDGWQQDSVIVEMLPGEIKVVHEFGYNVDTGDWQTLADFGVWTISHYPAQHYALIPSNHGGAWRGQSDESNPLLKGICYDETSSNHIGVANGELAAALTAITNAAGRKLDFLVYDACVMGSWEMAEVGAPYADYMLASEESHYGFQNFTEWLTFLVDNLATVTVEELGEVFVDLYAQGGQFGYPGNAYAVSVALTDLRTTPDLTAVLNAFADALMVAKTDSFYAKLDVARRNTQFMEYRFLVDLGDLARHVIGIDGVPPAVKAASQALLAQLDKTVVYDWANIHGTYKELTGATGLSIYLPAAWYAKDYLFNQDYAKSGAVWAQHSTWDEFVQGFTRGNGDRCVQGTETMSTMGTSVSDTLSVDLAHWNWNNQGPYLAQSFVAPSNELYGVRLAVMKTEPDEHEHDGFAVGLRNAKGEWIAGPYPAGGISLNQGDVQYICFNLWGQRVQAGETLYVVLFPGQPAWHYQGPRFLAPIQWPLTYAADDASDPPYADGDAFIDDGENGEMPVQDYNQDGIRASFWFEVY